MQFNETLDANTTLVGGSVVASPIAVNDSFSSIGNVGISVPAASSLFANDINPGGGTLSVQSVNQVGLQGILSLNTTTGAFDFTPNPGFEGATTFTYTLANGTGLTNTATVTINVSGMIWFINASAPGPGDGRLGAPFNSIANFNALAADDPGDNIFLFSGAYTGGLTLLANQRVIGQGAGATLATITGVTVPTFSNPALPATGGARPTVTTTIAATSAFTLAAGNTMRGFDIGNTTSADIIGTSVGTFTATEMTLSGTGRALDINGGTLAATFDSITSTSSGTQGIVLQNVSGSLTAASGTTISGATTQGILVSASTVNANFGNTSIAAGTDGVSLQNNSAGTRTFGTLSTTNGSGVGFLHAVGGGTTTVSGAATFTNPGGRCIDIQDSTTAITFANVNATQCGGTGVFMDDNTAGGTVSFADLDISPDSGQRCFHATDGLGTITTTSGTIAPTGAGIPIEIVGLSLVSLQPLNMTLTSVSATGAASGIILTNTSSSGSPGGFRVLGNGGNCTTADPTCTGGTIQNTTGSGIVATNAESLQLTRMRIVNPGNHGIDAPNLKGTCLFSNSMVVDWTFATGNGIQVVNNNTNLTLLTVTGSTFNGTATSNTGVRIEAQGASNMTLSVEGGTLFTDMFGDGVQSVTTSTWTNTSTVNVSVLNSFFNNAATLGNGGIHTDAVGQGTFNYTYSGNNFNNIMRPVTNLGAINANMGCPLGCASNADGPTVNGTISNNTLDQIIGSRGISIIADTLAKRLNVTVDNNFIDRLPNGKYAIFASSRNTVPDANVTIINNDIGTLFPLVLGNTEVVFVQAQDSSTMKTLINNNIVSASTAFEVIKVVGSTGTANVQATITNNNATDTDATARQEIEPRAAATTTVCADIRSNFPGGAAGRIINLDEISGATLSVNPGPNTASVAAANNAATVTTTGSGAAGFFTGSCTLPSIAPLAEEGLFNTNSSSENNLSFLNTTYQSPLTSGELRVESGEFEAGTTDWSAGRGSLAMNAEREQDAEVSNVEISGTVMPPLATFASEPLALQSAVSSFLSAIGEAISPTVTAQDTKEQTPNISGETITVGAPTGFTLPASKSITIKFRATVNNTPVGLTQVSTQGTVSGSNFGSVLTDDTAVGGGADPTVTLIDSTTITVASSQNPSITGQSVTFTATLTGAPVHGVGNPGGTVQFFDNGVAVGAPVAVVAGAVNTSTAQFVTSSLTAGNHPITATYSGGAGFNANNTSNTVNQSVSNTAVWDGSADANWNTAANWATNGAPSLATNDVSIPAAGVTNNPTISAADVTVNNLTLSAGRTLTINTSRTLNINGLLTMNGNNIDASSGLVAFSSSGTVTRTSGSILGNVDKSFTATSAFTYHVGTATGYSPVAVNITALATNPSTLRVLANDGTAPAVPVLVDATTLDRFWTLTETGDLTANVVFNYLEVDVDGTETNYKTIRVVGTTATSIPNGVPCPGAGSPCVDAGSNTITVNGLQAFSNWTAGELAPTAAAVSVSGRVFDSQGRGVFNAEIRMTDSNGAVQTARTNHFGYYRFNNVGAGESYVFSVRHKLHEFVPQIYTIDDARDDLDFVASPD